ncbi:MAG TPA: M20 family metallo-hydrolase [Spirochaetia bacterium]|nr:M20 family metallo-hydrolase [Spirochaetia bacterium]
MDTRDTLRKLVEGKRDQVIALQKDLTAVPALAPQNGGTGETEKARVLAGWLTRLGLGTAESLPVPDPRVPGGERPNLLLTLPGRTSERSFWIMSHMDIVPPGELSLWESDPYALVVKGDRLIGRGVEDNQQGLVSSVIAALCLKEAGLVPPRTVKLLFVADEETGSDFGIQALVKRPGLFGPRDEALVPDGGSEDGSQIEIAEKSLLWLRFRVRGRQCHASTPQRGVNAFEAGSHLVVRLGVLAERYGAEDHLFDPPTSTFTPTKKEANVPNVNTLPGEDVFYLDSRILPREDVDEVISQVRSICDGVQRDFGVGVDIQTVQRASSPPTPADAPVVTALKRAVKDVYGVEGKTVGIGGGTVGAFLRKIGIPTVVWGKIGEAAHQPNEFCLLPNLLGDAVVMSRLMMDEG